MEKKMVGGGDASLRLARAISDIAKKSFESGEMLDKVTPVTSDLLRYWFLEPYTERPISFHDGQKMAVLNAVWLHEVAKIESVIDLYEKCAPKLMDEIDLDELSKSKYKFPKYAVKMATGTGKTWVMHALLLWQYLNAKHEKEHSGRFTKNFLLVAPGLIVYDRLLDAYCGKQVEEDSDKRDFAKSDFKMYCDLFLPPSYREEAFSFIQNNVVCKNEIGRKVTGDGLIAITNWHLFLTDEDKMTDGYDGAKLIHPSIIIKDLLPARPGTAAGNSLEVLDGQYLRGNEIEFLANLPDLMVVNDEAHHIHETSVKGETDEVEWQKGLDKISSGEKQFMQVDFSATPYNSVGTGDKITERYFPHIIADFPLEEAIMKGLVKIIAIDKRKEITDLPALDYKAIRNEDGTVCLSEGQKLMLRAGFSRLQIFEGEFVPLAGKYPKMFVVCEDTSVTPVVEQFFLDEGLSKEDLIRIDSDRRGELKEEEWSEIKRRLFNIDNNPNPRIIISVMMLREGFDVNNICVTVPLRTSGSRILLEQIIGRGLRLMWREPEYQDEKEENRRLVLVEKKEPKSFLDMLSIVEHPEFIKFYEDMLQGSLGSTGSAPSSGNAVGDLIKVGLKPGYENYDLFWPVIISGKEEEIPSSLPSADSMEPFILYPLDKLRKIYARPGETFVAQDLLVKTMYGEYKVNANLFNATSYNQYIQRLLNCVTNRLVRVNGATRRLPTLQVNLPQITRMVDSYIRERLFSQEFDPFEDNNWKILLAQNGLVTRHIVKQVGSYIYEMQQHTDITDAVVDKFWFSSVPELRMRKDFSLELRKCIYERLPFPSHGGGFEKDFMLFLDADGKVERFIKISENQHAFAIIPYMRDDGLQGLYHPDFMVRTAEIVYVVETKGQDKVQDANVRRKQLATIQWCKQINGLDAEDRMEREWRYVLLSEDTFRSFEHSGVNINDLCDMSSVSEADANGVLF